MKRILLWIRGYEPPPSRVGTGDGASQWCNRLLREVVAGFALGNGRKEAKQESCFAT
jgi:hypothetical protein